MKLFEVSDMEKAGGFIYGDIKKKTPFSYSQNASFYANNKEYKVIIKTPRDGSEAYISHVIAQTKEEQIQMLQELEQIYELTYKSENHIQDKVKHRLLYHICRLFCIISWFYAVIEWLLIIINSISANVFSKDALTMSTLYLAILVTATIGFKKAKEL